MGEESLGEKPPALATTRRSSFPLQHHLSHQPTTTGRFSPVDLWSDDEGSGQSRSHPQHTLYTQLTEAPSLSNQRLQQAVPVAITGITGSYASSVNGIYLPTSLSQNEWPIYRRVNDNSSHSVPSELRELSLCLEVAIPTPAPVPTPISATLPLEHRGREEKRSSRPPEPSAWIIRNSHGVIYARCRLPPNQTKTSIPPEQIQFHDQHGVGTSERRDDIYWEMRSSIEVFGFRKRQGGVMRPASLLELSSVPQLTHTGKEGFGSRSQPKGLLSESGGVIVDDHTLSSSLMRRGVHSSPERVDENDIREKKKISNSILRGRVGPVTLSILTPSLSLSSPVILLGESGVGKTSLIDRFHRHRYLPADTPKTMSVDLTTTELECLNGRNHLKCRLDCLPPFELDFPLPPPS
jgi:hypothetical protein